MYLKANAPGLRFDADPANVEPFLAINSTMNRASSPVPVPVTAEITLSAFGGLLVRVLHTGPPRSDHRVASLALEQQCNQHPDQQEVRGVRNQIERPGPLISQAIRNLIGIQCHAMGNGDSNRDKFEGRGHQQTKVGPCHPTPPAAPHRNPRITPVLSVCSPTI